MNRPIPYETAYKADRRKHHHRCLCCSKVIKDGESVLMWRISASVSRAVHAACASHQLVSDKPETYRDLASLQCQEYARALGFKAEAA